MIPKHEELVIKIKGECKEKQNQKRITKVRCKNGVSALMGYLGTYVENYSFALLITIKEKLKIRL